ncbi:integrin alpha-8-like [Palaemon carinicauda]|uniref:integrin alpha-8-like n=1 Tax=Palaemon carinicauda TaxID=392227 RepID=UPI0035B5E1FF
MGCLEDLVFRWSFVFLTLQTGRHFAGAYNVDKTLYKVVSGQEGSYFGVSVALWSDTAGKNSLAVGAPRGTLADSSNQTFPFGNLYLCQPMGNGTEEPCVIRKDIPYFDINKHDNSKEALLWDEATYLRHGIGLGETVFASDEKKSKLVVCAPRFPRKMTVSGEDHLQSRGACFAIYKTSGDDPEDILPYKYDKLRDDRDRDVLRYNTFEGTGFAVMGFSAFLQNDGQSLYLGGPAAFFYEGVNVKMTKNRNGNTWKRSKSSQRERKENGLDNQYSGWAIVVGKLCSGQKECVATSSPGYDDHRGKVTIYRDDLKSTMGEELLGKEKGIGFGLSLGIGDFNGDGQDDLVVGAPFAKKKGAAYLQDTGKVIIYLAPTENASNFQVLEGLLPWGRFGHAVISPGDLDSDGYADLAVGAPFTYDGKGSVYIYNGGPEGIRTKPSQVIHASEFHHHPISWFGYSLDGGLDFDDNGHPDLIVGAPGSDQAVFLRTGPVISIQGNIEFDSPVVHLNETSCSVVLPDGIRQNVVCFNLTITLQYSAKHFSEPIPLRLRVELDHYRRLAFTNSHNHAYSSTQMITHVDDEPVHLILPVYVKPNVRHMWMSEDVEAQLNVSLVHKSRSGSNLLNVISAYSKTTFGTSTTFECPPPMNCLTRSDLILIADKDPEQLIVSDGLLNIEIAFEVRNNTAYAVTLAVTLPDVLEFWQVQSDNYFPELRNKTHIDSKIVLDFLFTSQIPKGLTVPLTFTFKHSATNLLEYGQPDLSFGFVIQGDTQDLDDSNNARNIEVPVISKVELSARGWSMPDQVDARLNETLSGKVLLNLESPEANTSDVKPQDLGPKITHHFILVNHGPSPLIHGQIVLGLPLQIGKMKNLTIFYPVDPIKTSGNLRCSSLILNPLNLTTDSQAPENETTQGSTTSTEDSLEWTSSSPENPPDETAQKDNSTRQKRSLLSSQVDQPAIFEEELTLYPPADNVFLDDAPQVTTPTTKNTPPSNSPRKKSPIKLGCDLLKCEEIMCDITKLGSGTNITIEVSGYIVAGVLEVARLQRALIETGMAFYTSQKNVFLNNHIVRNTKSYSDAYRRINTYQLNEDEDNDIDYGHVSDPNHFGNIPKEESEKTFHSAVSDEGTSLVTTPDNFMTEKDNDTYETTSIPSPSNKEHISIDEKDQKSSEAMTHIASTERQEISVKPGKTTSSYESEAEIISPNLSDADSSDFLSGKIQEYGNDISEKYISTTDIIFPEDSMAKNSDISTGISTKTTESTDPTVNALESNFTNPDYWEISVTDSVAKSENLAEYRNTNNQQNFSTYTTISRDLLNTVDSDLSTEMSNNATNSTDFKHVSMSRETTFNSYHSPEALRMESKSSDDYDVAMLQGNNNTESENTTSITKNRNKPPKHPTRRYDVRVSTYITVIKKAKTYEGFNINSILSLRGLELIGAIVGGLMGIIILCSLLHMCGFFKRKRISKDQREELEKVKKERLEKEMYG